MDSAPLNHKTCPNCGSSRQLRFCPECGQKRRTDYTLRSIFSDATEMFLGTDSRFYRTIKDYLRPGIYLKNWFDGKQARYLSPIKLFLIINLFYFLFLSFMYNFQVGLNTFVTPFSGQLYQQAYSDLIREGVISMINERGYSLSNFAEIYDSRVFSISNTLIIILSAIFSIFLFMINFRKTKLAYHHLNTGIYYSSFLLVIGLVLNILIALSVLFSLGVEWIGSDGFLSSGILILATIFFGMAQYRIFSEKKWVAALKGIMISFLSLFIGIFVYRFILLWITIWSVFWFS